MNFTHSLPRRLFAEFVGTFVVVLAAAGSVCVESYFRIARHTVVGPFGYAITYGLVTAVMVCALENISGGHLNPAVTVAVWVSRRMGAFQSLFYCIAQMTGAVAAAYLITISLPDTNAAWRTAALQSITPEMMIDFTRWQAMLVEGAATFVLVFVYFASGIATRPDTRSVLKKIGCMAIGLTISIGVIITRPFTGAAMNPARTFGPALATHHWQNHGIYWVGPLFGGLLAAVIYDLFFQHHQPHS